MTLPSRESSETFDFMTATRTASTRLIWPAPIPRVRSFVPKQIALDFTFFTTRQLKRIASNSSLVGTRSVTTFSSRLSSPMISWSLSMTTTPPGIERTTGFLRTFSHASVIWTMRRPFFLRIVTASGVYSGAMMISVKISEMTRAVASSKGLFMTITPPKGACLSVSKALSHASRSESDETPTPHGLVCLSIARAGLRNSVMRSAAASISRMFV